MILPIRGKNLNRAFVKSMCTFVLFNTNGVEQERGCAVSSI